MFAWIRKLLRRRREQEVPMCVAIEFGTVPPTVVPIPPTLRSKPRPRRRASYTRVLCGPSGRARHGKHRNREG